MRLCEVKRRGWLDAGSSSEMAIGCSPIDCRASTNLIYLKMSSIVILLSE